MTLLVLLGVLAVLCVAGLVAVGRGDGLPDAEPDRSPLGELPEGPLGVEHVRALRFSLAFRGYRMAEVDAALTRLADEIAARDARIGELERRDPTEGESWPSSS